jgi:hypothetical protein
MSSSKMRVEIPTNPKSLLDLAEEVYAKHTDKGAASPLASIEENNWTEEGPKIKTCLDKHNEAEKLKNQMEQAYKDRDKLLLGIDKAVKASRDVLSGIYHANMKRLTDWGFIVTESPKSSSDKEEESK